MNGVGDCQVVCSVMHNEFLNVLVAMGLLHSFGKADSCCQAAPLQRSSIMLLSFTLLRVTM